MKAGFMAFARLVDLSVGKLVGVAALLLMQRSPGRSALAASNAASCAATPRASSASLKWVISEISSTWGRALSRVQAAR